MKSWLPEAAGNIFQRIKAQKLAAEAKGIEIINLSIGQPTGPAIEMACASAGLALMSRQQNMHEYQDNGCLPMPDFAQRFVQCHVDADLATGHGLKYLPIPGIKPMLGLVPIACGASFGYNTVLRVATLTDPGYPTPAYWCGKLGAYIKHHPIELRPANGFLFTLEQIQWLHKGLLMMNYPHNPSGKAMNREWLTALCAFCEKNNIRIFNDAAYAILSHKKDSVTLADVAVDFPNLSWMEAFSASKAGNFTGWRIGAMVGSADFVDDMARIKGDADSGFAAPLAIGILDLFESGRDQIDAVKELYRARIEALIKTLSGERMRLAVEPDAGFFTLWQAPGKAFGGSIKDAEQFNNLMIENTGVMGVPFGPYIRYAVVGPVIENIGRIENAFIRANVSY